MAAYFVDDPLDSVELLSVLGLFKYVTQCSHWPQGCHAEREIFGRRRPRDQMRLLRKEGSQTPVASQPCC